MPTNPRVGQAFKAMKALGISDDKVKPVLKRLLKLYDKNWEPIEEENYRVLLDAIFETEEAEAAKKKTSASHELWDIIPREQQEEEAQEPDEMEQPLKRSRVRYLNGQSSQSQNNSGSQLVVTSLIQPKDEPVELPALPAPEMFPSSEDEPGLHNGDIRNEAQQILSQPLGREKRNQTVSPNSLTKAGLPSSTSGTIASQALIQSPIPVVYPERSSQTRDQESRALVVSQLFAKKGPNGSFPAISIHAGTDGEQEKFACETSSQLQIASSSSGEVKLSLSYNILPQASDFHIPNIDEVVKLAEDRCLRSYRILDPNFSLMKVMEDICECFLLLRAEKPQSETQISSDQVHPSVPTLMPSDTTNDLLNVQPGFRVDVPLNLEPLPAFTHEDCIAKLCDSVIEVNRDLVESKLNAHEDTNSKSLIPFPEQEQTADDIHPLGNVNAHDEADDKSLVPFQEHQQSVDVTRPLDNVIDICNGQESYVISLVNEVNSEYPPSFRYISQNVIFQNAYVNFSLARIEETNSCSSCFEDCLSLSIPCACAHETGGEFAYTVEGLVKEEFIEECISMNRDPEQHCQYFCKECPLERSKKEDIIEPCRGHLVRKFIKECWWKCGCDKQCGNRVVQRGITRNLQVFMTNGKGWGLRTLEDLPKGAFVCEYVGEVLTNAELFQRVSASLKGEEHSYPVLLDADWGSEGVLKDEEALCLDATHYGNVARFINHRCFDSTLVEIPVEIETPDHHYYHLAFFTTREVKAMEELTWDYGIDFNDRVHPVKAFRCQCGSRYCRNIRRSRSE